ncbi:MAG TPA: hypothetical protein VF840_04875 [Terriglobales bacterium]
MIRSSVTSTSSTPQLDEIFGGIFGGSAEDGAHSVCHGGVEDNRAHLNPGEIDTHLLASLQHGYTSDSATISARQS